MAMKTAQAKQARRSLALRTAAAAAAWTVLFAVLAVTALPALWQKAAYVFADVVSPWTYITEDEYVDLQLGRQEYVQQYSESSHAGSDADGGSGGGGTPTVEYYETVHDLGFWSDGTLFAVRDLRAYHSFLDMGPEAAVAAYFCGALVIAAVAGNRALKRLDDLSAAVTGLFADRFAPIELPDELSAARSELVQIQNRALSDERAAKAAETRKNELVAYLAHDIRTPLTSVIGYLSILKETPDLPVEDRAKLAGIALEKAERLEGLVGEFFEITRYNLQAIPIERERVGVSLFLGQVADELRPEAGARGVAIEVSAPEEAVAFIDPEKMARAVSNVLKNAVSFADEGTEVRLSAETGDGFVTMRVADAGREIAPVHLEAIFEKFFREDGARTSEKGGAGLGLAIAKEIVEAHGGTIAAESSLGQTVFTIRIPEDPAAR